MRAPLAVRGVGRDHPRHPLALLSLSTSVLCWLAFTKLWRDQCGWEAAAVDLRNGCCLDLSQAVSFISGLYEEISGKGAFESF